MPAYCPKIVFKAKQSLLFPSLLICALLTGCGGGGGGTVSSNSAAPEATLLAIDEDNAVEVSASAFNYSEMVFEFGEAALITIAKTDTTASYPLTRACDGGTQTDEFIDYDSNGTLSAGDVLRSTYSHCHDAVIGGTISGVVTMTLSVPLNLSYSTAKSGNLQFTDFEIVLDDQQNVLASLSGDIEFNSFADALNTILEVSTPASGFKISAQSNSKIVTEKIIVTMGRKSLRYDQARYGFELDGTLQSQILNGAATIKTTTTVSGQLGALPDTGKLVVAGKLNSNASFNMGAGTPNGNLTLITMLNSNQPSGPGILFPWTSLSDGYVWNDPLNPNGNFYPALPPASLSLLYTNIPTTVISPALLSVAPTVSLQYNKIIDANNLPSISFVPQNSNNGNGTIGASAEVIGAKLILRPSVQLRHGTTYNIFASGTINTTDNESAYVSTPSFTTPDTLVAASVASKKYGLTGDLVTLDASSSRSNIGALSYQWEQTSGTPVNLSTPSAPSINFSIPSMVSTGELLKFQVKITAPNGEYETSTIELPAYASANDVELFYFVSDSNDFIGKGLTKLISTPPYLLSPLTYYPGSLGFNFFLGDYSSSAQLSFAGPNHTPLQVAQYLGATRDPFNDSEPGLSITMDSAGCNQITGAFNVLEISLNGDGSVNTFAADFIQHCEGGPPSLRGAIRIHSAIPLPSVWPF